MTRTPREIVLAAYEAYNARDIDSLQSFMTEDVDWPNGTAVKGDPRLHGPAALREYWREQWTRTRTYDEPTDVTVEPDGRVKVRLAQVVTDLEGTEVSRGSFDYYFTLTGALISRLDIVKV